MVVYDEVMEVHKIYESISWTNFDKIKKNCIDKSWELVMYRFFF